MNKSEKLFLILFLIGVLFTFLAGSLSAESLVKALLSSGRFHVGDKLKVLVNIEGNPGLHGLYFNLDYDETVLSFEGAIKTNFTGGYPQDGELMYASSLLRPSAAGAVASAHVVASYTLNGKGLITKSNGTIAELTFRVIGEGTPGSEFSLDFTNCGLIDGLARNVEGVSWENSDKFIIESPYTGAFIHIDNPKYYQVFHKEA